MIKKILLLVSLLIFSAPVIAAAQYYVKPGDTLTGIAKKNGMNYADLRSLNPNIVDPNKIFPGQHIVIRSKDVAHDLIDYSISLMDTTKYVYGGNNAPYQADCSSWTQYIFKKFGYQLPRTSREQSRVGIPVAFKDLQPGDLMFFSYDPKGSKTISHVGIYIGGTNGDWISNLNTKRDVVIMNKWGTWTQAHFMWAQRILK